ncbi:hypothetical protein [Segetibacter koreensis]|uniref:hypothetical protein n=1 Tax=Segetibacter koreensis TaxID=398037 RepID=UPI000374C3AC|nr:hypothetical protein [Segetibacter koreensis]
MNLPLNLQIIYLFLLATPIACIAWTVTHEEVFREPRDFCVDKSKNCNSLLQRKFFYLFTCEYCFSHYVTIFFLIITRYHLVFDDWRGYLIGGFSLVWIANLYMSAFGRLRIDIKKERLDANLKEEELKKTTEEVDEKRDVRNQKLEVGGK